MKLIVKAIFFYITTFASLLWISSIDALVANAGVIKGLLLPFIAFAVLYYICYKTISYRDLIKISLSNKLDKYLRQ